MGFGIFLVPRSSPSLGLGLYAWDRHVRKFEGARRSFEFRPELFDESL